MVDCTETVPRKTAAERVEEDIAYLRAAIERTQTELDSLTGAAQGSKRAVTLRAKRMSQQKSLNGLKKRLIDLQGR